MRRQVVEGKARVVGREGVARYRRGEGGGGGERQGVRGGRPDTLLVHASLVPGSQLLHAQAGVGPVLRGQGVQGPRPQGPHVGGGRGAKVVQERGEWTAASALQW